MNSIQKARRAQAAVLTSIAVATVVAIAVVFGPMGFVLSAITLPLPIMVLWLASDVLRSDERAPALQPTLDRARVEAPKSVIKRAA